jgi:hypothetical protein
MRSVHLRAEKSASPLPTIPTHPSPPSQSSSSEHTAHRSSSIPPQIHRSMTEQTINSAEAPRPEEKRPEGEVGASSGEAEPAPADATSNADASGSHEEAEPAVGGEQDGLHGHAAGMHAEGEEGEAAELQPPEDPEIVRKKLEAADACKAEGNRLYGEGKWEEAAAKYVEAIDAGGRDQAASLHPSRGALALPPLHCRFLTYTFSLGPDRLPSRPCGLSSPRPEISPRGPPGSGGLLCKPGGLRSEDQWQGARCRPCMQVRSTSLPSPLHLSFALLWNLNP